MVSTKLRCIEAHHVMQAQQEDFSLTLSLQSRQGSATQYNATQQLQDIALVPAQPGRLMSCCIHVRTQCRAAAKRGC